jgi:hypothetical protein
MHPFYIFDDFVVYKLAIASEKYHKKTRLNALSKICRMASRTLCAALHLHHHPHPISSCNLLAGTKNSARSGRSICASQNKRQRFCSYKVQSKLPNETQRMTMRSRIKVPIAWGQLPLLSPVKRHRGIDVWRQNSGPRQPTWRQKARMSRGITRSCSKGIHRKTLQIQRSSDSLKRC